jgi:hypothetical protein
LVADAIIGSVPVIIQGFWQVTTAHFKEFIFVGMDYRS